MKFPKLSLPKTVIKVLENKYVLYFVFFLALINLFGYMVLGNIHAILFFILVGFLSTFFTKNMIVVLSVPIVLTSVLMIGQKVKESFETMDEKEMKVKASKESGIQKQPDIVYPSPTEEEVNEISDDVSGDMQGEEPMTTMYKKNNRVDYASTIEDAYTDLNTILSGDGIKNLTSDTQKLMSQQLQLADAMKSMSPLLESAKGLLQGFDMKNLSSLSTLAKNFNMGNISPDEV